MQRKQLNGRSAQRLHLLLKLKFSSSEIMHEVIINFESFEMYDLCSYIKFRNYYWVIYNVNVSKAII